MRKAGPADCGAIKGVQCLNNLPKHHNAFTALIAELFPPPAGAGVTVRTVGRPGHAHVTLVYLPALLDPTDLERLVLTPVSQGIPAVPPEQVIRHGHFPAAEIRVAADASSLLQGLLTGLAAVHIHGHDRALLVGSGRAAEPQDVFGPDLGANIAILHRHLRNPNVRSEMVTGPQGNQYALVYLRGQTRDQTIQAVRNWYQSQGRSVARGRRKQAWWAKATAWLRLPPVVDVDSVAEAAAALRHGYVAVLDDHLPGVRLAPLTLDRLLSGPNDHSLVSPLDRLVRWPRLLAATVGLLLSAGFVAIASYHHALFPGPFLMALASSRQNPPFPIVLEVLLVELLGDAIRHGTLRLGGRPLVLLALIATALSVMLAVQAGIVGAVSGVVGLTNATIVQALPNRILRRVVGAWHYLFIGAAAGMGLYGVALLGYALFVYLGEEKPFGHHVWLSLEVRSP